MVHLSTCKALLSLVTLWGLVSVPHLLRWLTLHWSVGSVPLGASIGIMTSFSTLETSDASGGAGPCWGANWGYWATLLGIRTWSLLHWGPILLTGLLELLSGTLKLLGRALRLLLPKVPTRASKAIRGPLRWSKTRVSATPRLSLRDSLSLLFSQLFTLVLQANSAIHQLLESREAVGHELVLERSNQFIQE